MFSILVDYLLEAEEQKQPVWLIQHVNTGGSNSFEGLPAQTDLWCKYLDTRMLNGRPANQSILGRHHSRPLQQHYPWHILRVRRPTA